MSDAESSPPTPPARPDNAVTLAPRVWIMPGDLRYSFTRSSGPGGQAVNKLATRAELRVAVSDLHGLDDAALRRLRRMAGQRLTAADELLIASDTHRSQLANRRACLERLKALVARAATRPKKRKPTRPSRGAIERRLTRKSQQGEKKRRRGWRGNDH